MTERHIMYHQNAEDSLELLPGLSPQSPDLIFKSLQQGSQTRMPMEVQQVQIFVKPKGITQ